METRDQLKLPLLLKEMEVAMNQFDLSDAYLRANYPDYDPPRIGEFQYGVSSVPCEWVYPYLRALVDDPKLHNVIRKVEEKM